jgi:hypothetical protein
MSYDIQTDGNKPAPTWFWVSLALIIIATIIAFFIFQNDRERNQLEMEKKIAGYNAFNPTNIYGL